MGRQKFRSFEKLGCQTYVEFSRHKEQFFDRWCHSQKVDKAHHKLRQLILIGVSDPSVEKSSAKFDVAKYIRFLPPFQQADVDKYFLHFEKVAGNQRILGNAITECIRRKSQRNIYTVGC